jgi:glycosyltransferase involved in cell wall biosynthesis
MHIVHFCPTPYPIPPVGYGGTERVVYWLVRAQHQAGLRVSVVAHPSSTIESVLPGVTLIPWDEQRTLEQLLPPDCDVLHLHKLVTDPAILARPHLITEHSIRGPDAFQAPNTVFVSQAHAAVHGRKTYVRNGVPVQDYRYSEEKDRFLLFLSRMEWPRKNARTAMDLAVDLKVPLKMSGKYAPWVRPKLYGAWARHPLRVARYVERIGYIDGEQKLDLLARAPFLFHAVNWHEPGAIAVLEALASGTPVLVTPNGSLTEFVDDGETGIVVRDYAEALDATRRLLGLSAAERRLWAQRCRERVSRIEDTAEGYLALYRRVIAGEQLAGPDERHPARPRPIVSVLKPAWS